MNRYGIQKSYENRGKIIDFADTEKEYKEIIARDIRTHRGNKVFEYEVIDFLKDVKDDVSGYVRELRESLQAAKVKPKNAKPKVKKNDIRDKKYLAWARKNGKCAVTGLNAVEAGLFGGLHVHHIDGKGRFTDDTRIVLLTADAHVFGANAYHRVGKKKFVGHFTLTQNIDLKKDPDGLKKHFEVESLKLRTKYLETVKAEEVTNEP